MASKDCSVASLLECPICLSDFEDPRMLPCLHTLCRGCLESHVSASGQGGKFSCPSCRHECQIPNEGLSTIPKNFLLNSLKELLYRHPEKVADENETLGKSTQSSGHIECDNAKGSTSPHGKVTVFCVDCAEFYCGSCESSHRMFRLSKGHQMRPANEVDTITVQAATRGAKTITCKQHPTQHPDFYCDTCQVPVCSTCCVRTHKQHDRRELVIVSKEFLDKLTDWYKSASVHTSKLHQHLEELQTSQQDIQRDVYQAHQAVDQAADGMTDIVNKRRQYLHKQLDEVEQSALTEIKAACKETEINKTSIESLQSYIQALQLSGDVTDYVTHTPSLEKQLHQQQALPLHAVTWTANFKNESNSVAALDAMLGTVGVNHSTGTAPSAAPVDVKDVKLGDPVQTLNQSLGRDVEGIALIGNVVCVVYWRSKYLWLYHLKSQKEKKSIVDGLSAVGMAALHKTDLASLVITDIYKKLYFAQICTGSLKMTNCISKNIPFEPRHIKVDSTTGKLVIANYTDKEIVICDNTGNIECRVKIQVDVKHVWCAMPNEDLYAVLDHSKEGRIHWLDSHETVVYMYGQGGDEGLCYPTNMASDSLGNMIVSDKSNHRLHLVDVHKQLSCYLLTEANGIRNPTAVYLDETTSQLYVACKDVNKQSIINIYKWPLGTQPTAISTSCTHHRLQVKLGRYK